MTVEVTVKPTVYDIRSWTVGGVTAWIAGEPNTSAGRYSQMGYMGIGSGGGNGMIVDSTVVGYWLMACELWLLLQDVIAGSRSAADYYPVPS